MKIYISSPANSDCFCRFTAKVERSCYSS